jgi:hypothetical protein
VDVVAAAARIVRRTRSKHRQELEAPAPV